MDGIFERKPSAAMRAVKVSAGWPYTAIGEKPVVLLLTC
jgi:hypothetical protein